MVTLLEFALFGLLALCSAAAAWFALAALLGRPVIRLERRLQNVQTNINLLAALAFAVFPLKTFCNRLTPLLLWCIGVPWIIACLACIIALIHADAKARRIAKVRKEESI